MKTANVLGLSLLLVGCQTAPAGTAAGEAVNTSALERNSAEWRGEKFARGRCADCHSVDYAETSPLAAAPSFAAIANTPGLDPIKLAQWLKDHRNYPDEMYFEIPQEHIDDLTAYMLTLRRSPTP